MKKEYAMPSLRLKEFERTSVIALSSESATNYEAAEKALRNSGMTEPSVIEM